MAKIDQVKVPVRKLKDYNLPSISLLDQVKSAKKNNLTKDKLLKASALLQDTLEDFGVSGKILNVKPNSVVTLYKFEPAAGVKSSRVIGLADDIARSMSAVSARVSVTRSKCNWY